MSFVSICKNIIMSNNKRNWVDPDPAIRVANTPSGKVRIRSNKVGIVDAAGLVVATVEATTDGKPIIKSGAKVALITEYPVINLE